MFEGNRRDAKTVPDVLRDIEQRFGLKRIVFVGDRGMVTSQNLEDLRGNGHGYIVGRNRRRSGLTRNQASVATATLPANQASNKRPHLVSRERRAAERTPI